MTPRRSHGLNLTSTLLSVILLPLAGGALAGRELREFFRFPPPLDIPAGYSRFSWLAATAVLVLLALVVAPWFGRLNRPRRAQYPPRSPGSSSSPRLPGWGWVALAWTLAWWTLAWTRWPWFDALQRYTFFPLWMGFIVTVNALVRQRTRTCLMLRAPISWLTLFAASAACWWTFEWLNRFVRNWHYLGVEDFGATSYALHASLCFSTVLPAVAAVAEWVGSHPTFVTRTAEGPRWSWLDRRTTAIALAAGGASALVATGVFPQQSYPALWVAPLALLLATQRRFGYATLSAEIARGNWTRAASWMIAALICGFFWEMWNWHSLAKWIYTVPGVERWHVFEMPLLGYAGYLPFGLECLLVTERVINGPVRSAPHGPANGGAFRPANPPL